MNAKRRKEIEKIIEALRPLRDDIETLKGQEEDYYDNMPESFQDSDKGSSVQDAINNFESAMDGADNAIEYLKTILEEA